MIRILLVISMSIIAFTSARATPWPDLAQPARATGGGEKDAALLIGIEDYKNLDHVKGARANIEAWDIWLHKTRKVPQTAVIKVLDDDAEFDEIGDKADLVAGLAKPGGTLWVVFIGHGLPSKDGTEGLLVGQDAKQNAHAYTHSVAQSLLLQKLSLGKQARTVLVLDSCFSGRDRGAEIVKGAQPLLVVSKQKLLAKNVTVLTAGKSDQFANQLYGAERPAFSYLMLGALRGWADEDADGKVTVDEALAFTRGALAQHPGVKQTPQVNPTNSGGAELVRSAGEAAPDLAVLLGKAGAKKAEAAAPVVQCPAGTSWNGSACVGVVVCPAGSEKVDGRCVAKVECPSGAHMEDGECVPNRRERRERPKEDDKTAEERPARAEDASRSSTAVPQSEEEVNAAIAMGKGTFRDNGDGTVQQMDGDLLWQRRDSGAALVWSAALTYCAKLQLAGAGWRLPSIGELVRLIDQSEKSGEKIDVAFANLNQYFWSASPYRPSASNAWIVDFKNGRSGGDAITGNNHVRCVR